MWSVNNKAILYLVRCSWFNTLCYLLIMNRFLAGSTGLGRLKDYQVTTPHTTMKINNLPTKCLRVCAHTHHMQPSRAAGYVYPNEASASYMHQAYRQAGRPPAGNKHTMGRQL